MANENLQVHDNEAAHRFEIRVDGHLAVLEYERAGDRMTMTHTKVPPAIEGRGIAGRLAQAALDDARHHNLIVVPVCPFVRSYVKRHPEYLPLIEPEYRAELG